MSLSEKELVIKPCYNLKKKKKAERAKEVSHKMPTLGMGVWWKGLVGQPAVWKGKNPGRQGKSEVCVDGVQGDGREKQLGR